MTVRLFVEFALWIIAAVALIQLIQKPIRKKCAPWVRVVLWIVKFLAAFAIVYEMIADASPLFWNWGYLFSGLYLALMGDLLAGLLCIPYMLKKNINKKVKAQTAGAILATLLITLHCCIIMGNINAHELTFTSDKLSSEHKIVFISDLHYGSSQFASTTEKAFTEVEKINPEAILLGGDITDEHTTKEEMQYVYKRFGEMNVPVYFIYGNHDRQPRGDYVGGAKYTVDELNRAITENGITILKDEVVLLSDDLAVLGREDPSSSERKDPSALPVYPEGAYIIAVEHNPYLTEDIQKQNADLQLSGHTHAGQLFPLRLLYTIVGLRVVGEYQEGDTTVYVSPGIGGWFYPMRNESHCWYEVITLKPQVQY